METVSNTVIPAKAGIQKPFDMLSALHWTPAFAGVTAPSNTVIPAKAGIQKPFDLLSALHWTPAFAGVTARCSIAR